MSDKDRSVVDGVTLAFEYTRAEYVAVARTQLARVMHTRRIVLSGLVFVVLGVVLMTLSLTKFGVAALAGGSCYVLWPFFLLWWGPRRSWEKADRSSIRGRITVVVSEGGVEQRLQSRDLRIAWEEISGLEEVPHYDVVMRANGAAALFIPKRAFSSPSEEARMKAMFERLTAR